MVLASDWPSDLTKSVEAVVALKSDDRNVKLMLRNPTNYPVNAHQKLSPTTTEVAHCRDFQPNLCRLGLGLVGRFEVEENILRANFVQLWTCRHAWVETEQTAAPGIARYCVLPNESGIFRLVIHTVSKRQSVPPSAAAMGQMLKWTLSGTADVKRDSSNITHHDTLQICMQCSTDI